MKVVEVNSVCGQGSTGKIALALYKLLEKHGHECYIAYGRGDAPEDIKTIKIGNTMDVLVHGVLSRLTGKHGFYSKRVTRQFIEKLKKMNVDVIHLHNIHGYYINISMLLSYIKEANIEVVWTLHDCWTFTGQCSHFDFIGCEKWKNGCESCPQTKEYPKCFKDNSIYNYKTKKALFTGLNDLHIVTPSYWLEDLVRESYLNYADIRTIHNGIDVNVFKPVDSDIRVKQHLEDKYIILCVANVWTPRKGYDHILELSKKIDQNTRIIMIGVTDKQKETLPENIIGITRTEDVLELVQYYSMADVFINPTLEDSYPTVNMEALACGTPVLTYPTGGSVESILNDKMGCVCKEQSVCSLLENIEFIKHKQWNRDEIRSYAKKYFDKDICFNEYLNLFESLVNKIR